MGLVPHTAGLGKQERKKETSLLVPGIDSGEVARRGRRDTNTGECRCVGVRGDKRVSLEKTAESAG